MIILLQFALILAVFVPVRWLAWMITEAWGLPEWLDYRPFNCQKCLTFWSLVAVYSALWLSLGCLYTGIGGIILAILNAIAMTIHQRNNTIKIEDI